MPSILLINDNKIVSRLLQLSSQKHNYNLEEINDYTPSENAYNVVFVDSEKYDEDAMTALKSTITYDKLGFMGDKSKEKPEGFDFVLEKPFLPTDFVTLMNENFKTVNMEEMPDEDALSVMEDVEEEELDLDNLEEMPELDILDEEIELDAESFEETIDMQQTTLTTGIAGAIVQEETEEDLSTLLNEIEEMEPAEELLEEMDLDALVDESEVTAALDASEVASVVDDNIVKESLEEVEDALSVELEDTEEKVEEDSIVDETIAASVVAATAATVAAAVAVQEEETQEELEETLNILDGVEAIETEDDYLKESEHTVEDLADEFDSLNEEEVEKLMSGEEVVSEEFTEVEEKVVEANDLEEMITRAVSKAITKEMLQIALQDMEITVKLQAKSKDS